jgi:hypothetical protein
MNKLKGFVAGFLLVVTIAFWVNAGLYKQDSLHTATKGILFKQTLNLDVYKKVSTGNDMLGKYARYSRSDRHNEVLTVYCRDYCSEVLLDAKP